MLCEDVNDPDRSLPHTGSLLLLRGTVSGTIDALRMTEIVNRVQLGFFDRYLKDSPISPQTFSSIPEIVIREHNS